MVSRLWMTVCCEWFYWLSVPCKTMGVHCIVLVSSWCILCMKNVISGIATQHEDSHKLTDLHVAQLFSFVRFYRLCLVWWVIPRENRLPSKWHDTDGFRGKSKWRLARRYRSTLSVKPIWGNFRIIRRQAADLCSVVFFFAFVFYDFAVCLLFNFDDDDNSYSHSMRLTKMLILKYTPYAGNRYTQRFASLHWIVSRRVVMPFLIILVPISYPFRTEERYKTLC